MVFSDRGSVPETFERLQKLLADAEIPHIFLGAIAVNAHGLRRSTADIDVCMRKTDIDRFRREIVATTYERVAGRQRKFLDPQTNVYIDVLPSGELAGNTRRQREVCFPDPSEAQLVDGIPVPSLARLIELKIVFWRYKDWGDVVDLIRIHELDESYGDQFNPLVRQIYLDCYDQMLEEDRYNPDIHVPPTPDTP